MPSREGPRAAVLTRPGPGLPVTHDTPEWRLFGEAGSLARGKSWQRAGAALMPTLTHEKLKCAVFFPDPREGRRGRQGREDREEQDERARMIETEPGHQQGGARPEEDNGAATQWTGMCREQGDCGRTGRWRGAGGGQRRGRRGPAPPEPAPSIHLCACRRHALP